MLKMEKKGSQQQTDVVGPYIFTRNTLCSVNEEINDKWPLLKALSDMVLSARNMTRLSCLFVSCFLWYVSALIKWSEAKNKQKMF